MDMFRLLREEKESIRRMDSIAELTLGKGSLPSAFYWPRRLKFSDSANYNPILRMIFFSISIIVLFGHWE